MDEGVDARVGVEEGLRGDQRSVRRTRDLDGELGCLLE
jgi:hypothetical protein